MTNPTANEEVAFDHYTLKHRLIAWVSINLFGSLTYTVRHGLLKGMKRKGGIGWVPEIFYGGGVNAEQQFWANLNLSGMTVYDVGAFQGLLTLFFASRASKVICFEPNTQNHKSLSENLRLNAIKNVEVRKVGVGSLCETKTMVSSSLMPGGASVDGKMVAGLLKSGEGSLVEEISIVTLDVEIPKAGLQPPSFIKIDIEGLEIEALRGASATLALYKPALFLEMHGETMGEKKRKVAEIVSFLWENNYWSILHVESGSAINPQNSDLAMQGHLYCRYGAAMPSPTL